MSAQSFTADSLPLDFLPGRVPCLDELLGGLGFETRPAPCPVRFRPFIDLDPDVETLGFPPGLTHEEDGKILRGPTLSLILMENNRMCLSVYASLVYAHARAE